DINDVAQQVQRSGHPEAYRDHETEGRLFASALTGQSGPNLVCTLDPVGSTVSPEQVRSELVRQFPRAVGSGRLSVGLAAAASAAPQLPADAGATALVIDPDGEDALGWAVANWAVARAADDGVVRVSYQGRVWDRSVRGEEASRWGEASGGTADHVVVLVSGRRPAPRPSADRGIARRETAAALLDLGLQLGQTPPAGGGALAHLLVAAPG